MAVKQYLAIFLIVISLAILFRRSLSTIILVGIILFLVFLLIRFLADLYWYGKDKGEW